MSSKKRKRKNKVQENKPRDFVAKNMAVFCHSTVEVDRKKKSKRMTNRKMKHKGKDNGY